MMLKKKDVQHKGPTLPVCSTVLATSNCRLLLMSHHYDQENERLNRTAVTTTKEETIIT